MLSNMAASTNHTTLLKNQSAIKYLPTYFSSQISLVRSFLCSLSIFGISKIPAHCLEEALVMSPLSASDMPILIMLRSILLTWNLTQSRHMKTESCHRFVINFPTKAGVNSNKAHSCLQLLLWNVFSC